MTSPRPLEVDQPWILQSLDPESCVIHGMLATRSWYSTAPRPHALTPPRPSSRLPILCAPVNDTPELQRRAVAKYAEADRTPIF